MEYRSHSSHSAECTTVEISGLFTPLGSVLECQAISGFYISQYFDLLEEIRLVAQWPSTSKTSPVACSIAFKTMFDKLRSLWQA